MASNISSEELNAMSFAELKELAESFGIEAGQARPNRNRLIKEIMTCLNGQNAMNTGNVVEVGQNDINEGYVAPSGGEVIAHGDEVRNMSSRSSNNDEDEGLSENLKFQLAMKRMELERIRIETERENERIRIETERENERIRIESRERIEMARMNRPDHRRDSNGMDISAMKQHLPIFREEDVQDFFLLFERIAVDYQFPDDKMALLLRSTLNKGKALDVVLSLTPEEINDYEVIKDRVLKSYSLTPEKYRKLFRDRKKAYDQTHVDFLRQKEKMLEQWLRSQNVSEFDKLKNLILFEEFNDCIRVDIKTHISDRGVEDVHEAARLADNYAIIHASIKPYYADKPKVHKPEPKEASKPKETSENNNKNSGVNNNSNLVHFRKQTDVNKAKVVCFNCKKEGHMKKDCWILTKKQGAILHCARVQKDSKQTEEVCNTGSRNSKEMRPASPIVVESMVFENSLSKVKENSCTQSIMLSEGREEQMVPEVPEEDDLSDFRPFVYEGTVSTEVDVLSKKKIQILRDTGSAVSVILEGSVPLTDATSTGESVVLRGASMEAVEAPLHRIKLESDIFTGNIVVGVWRALPVKGVSMILGNDIMGGRVTVEPMVKVLETKMAEDKNLRPANERPTCALTRAMQKKKSVKTPATPCSATKDVFVCSEDTHANETVITETPDIDLSATFFAELTTGDATENDNILSPKQKLVKEQLNDEVIMQLRMKAVDEKTADAMAECFYMKDEVLMRKSKPLNSGTNEWDSIHQIVIPKCYRQDILRMAHDLPFAGHMGVRKTHHRILPYFYWPGLRRDVEQYCKTCHVCQMVGRPNQRIPVAPLQPIPAFDEPFSHILIDCVGPLPKTKAGFQYLLTVMCSSTRFPEAIPLRNITTVKVVDALTNFFTRYGLPKTVQSDQGTNFTSNIFKQVMEQLGISHRLSSAYHPESQGALERFHQTLKSMLKKYCYENEKDWDKGVPYVLFAAREATQESLGFSPFELVYGHSVRGPLKLLHETWLTDSEPIGLLSYVDKFKNRLYHAFNHVKIHFPQMQERMRQNYDRKATARTFAPGDKVLVFLPLQNQPLSAKFSGPYEIESKLGEVNYLIKTPDRRQKQRVCHINLLKPYVSREKSKPREVPMISLARVPTDLSRIEYKFAESKLNNTDALKSLDTRLEHPPVEDKEKIIELVHENKSMFTNVPSRTHVIEHDVVLTEGARSIKQHPFDPIRPEHIKLNVKYMLEDDIGGKCDSKWSTPCVMVPKADHTLQFYRDFGKLSNLTKTDWYPIPRIIDKIETRS